MPLYTYRCSHCGKEYIFERTFAEHDEAREIEKLVPWQHKECAEDGYENRVEQVFSFSFHRGTPEHYNHSLDAYVSNDAQIRSELSRQSDEMSARMGFDHNYELVDPSDPAAVGVTDAGLEATERAMRDSGEVEATRTIIS